MALNFNAYATEGNSFLKKYAKDLDMGTDTDRAGRVLSSILHALRAIITFEESLQLIAQFPMFLKAVYVNGWSPKSKHKRVKNMTAFIDLVRQLDGNSSVHDLGSDEEAEQFIITTFIALRQYISLGELEDIRTGLPKDLKSMVYHNIMF